MRRFLPLLLFTTLVLAACGGQSSTPAPDHNVSSAPAGWISVRAVDYRFQMPTHWPAGWVTVTLLNNGGQPHQLQLARLRSGASLDQIRSDFAGPPARAFGQLALAGGPDVVEPRLGQQVTVWLDPGSYVALDLLVGPGGVQNVNQGMLQSFTVDQPAVQAQPVAQGTLVERSFGYDLPPIPAGPVVLRVQDQSAGDEHEAAIVRPSSGMGAGDVLAFLRAPEGPPPFRFVGGMAALEAGQTGFLRLDLDPGSYVMFCSVTDPDTGRFHSDGMIRSFTVTGR